MSGQLYVGIKANFVRQKLNGWELCVFPFQKLLSTNSRSHQDFIWNESPQRKPVDPKRAQTTQPKPDITYGFPIIQPSDDVYRRLSGDRNVDSFSLSVLGELRRRENLVSTPTTALASWASNKSKNALSANDLMCFPWAIVEVKRGTPEPSANDPLMNKQEAREHKKRTEFCYCQAANASLIALILREKLAEKANVTPGAEAAQVMFAFTCVGSTAKLWITYREKPVCLKALLDLAESNAGIRTETTRTATLGIKRKDA